MSLEDRVRYLLRAAGRAEGEGNVRAANALRRMARDVLPLDGTPILALTGPSAPDSDEA